ncbi:hypothetical protein SEMRO_1736_G294380.1 [Seminavis robusta]|uniref:Uncharacterized protein n=1 Tax=Seminavis robusta TaxID=568900 RepID=A0A9N8ESB0_9STRA|nr:hypothetical protein SEMRO_1736_G294380.1 [Seminavis robusta]|eukprot:Sro1736_g294380.1 n/a (470) ;mRNA; f:9238-10647
MERQQEEDTADTESIPDPHYVPLTQVQDDRDPCSDQNSEHTGSDDDDCIQGEAVLNCFFHVVHAFAQKKSYVKKIKNKDFGAPKGTAYRHVVNIASTKTVEQRQTITELYLQDWSKNRGEKAAADHLRKEYCCFPKWNWNYACSGEVGVYPSNCPNESFNRHGIKSVATDCSKNATLASFLVHTAPRLLQEDSHNRSDPCTIEIPKTSSVLAVGLTGFLQDGIDVVELGRDEFGHPASWLANIRYKIGVPIDRSRIRLIQASLDGDQGPFTKKLLEQGKSVREDQVADAMIRTTRTVCHLQWKQGNIVGDCEDCIKHLGYSCPGAIFLRSKHGLLHTTLEVLRKSDANSRGDAAKAVARGNNKRMYESGLCSSKKRRCKSKMIESFDAYLGTLNGQQLMRLVHYLQLLPRNGEQKQFESQTLLDILTSFYDNPMQYRCMLLGVGNQNNHYSVVRSIAGKMNQAAKENNL